MRSLIFLFCCIGLSQCSKPVASFLLDKDNYVLAENLKVQNTSTGAESYVWKVNGKEVSNDQDLEFQFLESGRFEVELFAKSASKASSFKQDVYSYSPLECMVLIRTSLGDLVVTLDEKTPGHLQNFTKLVESGYYNGLVFHRVIEGFMIQGGENKLRPKEAKSFKEPAEIPSEIKPELYHIRGALAAARMPDEINPQKKSSGSQFYIVDGSELTLDKLKRIKDEKLFDYTDTQIQGYLKEGGTPQLDGEYTVFGRLVSGFETLDKIASSNTDKFDKPKEDVRIIEAKMLY